jgi:hypothetical protein
MAHMPNYWINTVSRSHVQHGIEGGFTQANHGKSTTLKRLARGDLVAFYSPRADYPDGEPLQRFTAVGRVLDDAPYQAEMTPDFHPWRRRMAFLPAEETPIRELIPELAFIPDPQRWGMPFRRGLFQIGEADFQCIARAMRVTP